MQVTAEDARRILWNTTWWHTPRCAGSKEALDLFPELSELLRYAGDPDWRRYTKATWSFSSGVPLGVDVRLPRTPAHFFRKTKHRKFEGAAEQLSDELRLNYPSAREHELKIEEQFAKEVFLGAMIELPLEEARGAEHGWIGFSIAAHQRLLGISKSRADWMVGWIRKVKSDGFVNIADMGAVLGRLSFGLTLLPLLRPFLGPLYAWVAAVKHCHIKKLPKAIVLILSFLENFFMKDLRTSHVSLPIHMIAIGSRKGYPTWRPHGFSIASLELLATLINVIVFETAPFTHANFICSAATDNRGSSQLTARWLTTSFPLVAVLMELATVLQGNGLSLELHWAPRLQNSLADSLTNQDFKSFNPELRRRFSFSSYQSVVMKDMLDLGSTLYKDIAEWKSRKRGHTVQDKN
ncbi:unnamed protein product, partial [Symbiodinium necroappetens]